MSDLRIIVDHLKLDYSGVMDVKDAFPFDPNESTDTDNDGIGDEADADDDNDGLLDAEEVSTYRTDPLDSDTDKDGLDDGFEIAEGLDPTDSTDCPEWICGGGSRGWRLALLGLRQQVAPTVTTARR